MRWDRMRIKGVGEKKEIDYCNISEVIGNDVYGMLRQEVQSIAANFQIDRLPELYKFWKSNKIKIFKNLTNSFNLNFISLQLGNDDDHSIAAGCQFDYGHKLAH